MDQEPAFCSDISLQAGEPLYGSATQTKVFLLLEYDRAWGEKALEQSEIPEMVKARLKKLGKQTPGLKTLLIKTPGRQRQDAGLRFFVAALSQHPPRLFAFQLAAYPDLLQLDIPAVLAGDAAYDAYLQELPLYLVCTNGRRDLCCVRHGLAVYNALAAATQSHLEPLAWQCSHVGGHRFAANLICLPHGVLYGRVRSESALAILEADRKGRIYLPNLRGKVCDPPVVQAAEYYLRSQRGVVDIDAYYLLDAQEASAGEWLVRFETRKAGETHAVQLRVDETEKSVFESCTLDKSTVIVRYDFQTTER